jgi:hypothetical protein
MPSYQNCFSIARQAKLPHMSIFDAFSFALRKTWWRFFGASTTDGIESQLLLFEKKSV